jgi:hypothetical protein
MGYRLVADAAVAVHFTFVAFLVVGGFLSLRWPRVLYPHIAAAVWVSLLALGLKATCPLTFVENWARERAGEPGIPQGFIEAHVTGVLYPSNLEWLFRSLVGVAIVASWVMVARRRAHRHEGPDNSGISASTSAAVR